MLIRFPFVGKKKAPGLDGPGAGRTPAPDAFSRGGEEEIAGREGGGGVLALLGLGHDPLGELVEFSLDGM